MDLALHPHPRPWHKGSVFRDGPRRPLTSDQRRIWLARADAEHRAGNLTHCEFLVAQRLPEYLGADGRLDPSHRTIASGSLASGCAILVASRTAR